jgi:hypothetical protein
MTEISMPGAAESPASMIDKWLGYIPRLLASHAHIVWLLLLGIYLIVLPLLGVPVSAKSELIGGNYTNVTSDIGACIAAGGTLTLLHRQRKQHRVAEATHRIIADLYLRSAGGPHRDAIQEIVAPQE